MTFAEDSPGLCLCGCGEPVASGGKWKRGHYMRGEGGYDPGQHDRPVRALPDPDVPDEELDDMIDVVSDVLNRSPEELAADNAEVYRQPAARRPRPVRVRAVEPVSRDPEDDGGLPEDPEPAHAVSGRSKGKRAGGAGAAGSGARQQRVTVAVRKDVEAKIRMVAYPCGQMWAARDEVCGGTFAAQEPQISGALAEIVCDSPDLLAWFTGPTGKYMKFFNLFMACAPVGVSVYGHHVAHRGEQPQQDPNLPPVDYSQYAA